MTKADLGRSRDMDDVINREEEVREREEGTCEVPALDDAPDQPSSPIPTASQPIQGDQQEVLGDGGMSTGRRAEAPSNADISNREKFTMKENIGVQTSLDVEKLDNPSDEIIPTLQSAPIDCSPQSYEIQIQPSPDERQRPVRNASRPTRYRDTAFDTQFQPRPRRHRKIRRHEASKNYVAKEEYFRSGRGVGQKYSRSPPGPVKTSTASTTPPQASTASTEINKNVINARLHCSRTTMPTAAAAAVGGRLAATLPVQKVKVNTSNHGKTDTAFASMPGKIQTVNIDCPTISTQQNTSSHQFHRKKRKKRQRPVRDHA